MRCLLQVLLTILLAATAQLADPNKPLWIKKFDCVGQPYANTKVLSCGIKTARNNDQTIAFALEILKPLTDVMIEYRVYIQYLRARQHLYATSANYCDFIANYVAGRNPAADVAYGIAMKNVPQLVRRCPIGGVVNVTGVRVSESMLPSYVPAGSYYTEWRSYSRPNQTIFAWVAEFTVTRPSLIPKGIPLFG